jgi:hypothetical protein
VPLALTNYIHRMQLTLNQFFVLPAVVIVAATGIYQMDEGHWDYGDFWVSGTITILVLVAGIASSSSTICRRRISDGDGPRASWVR